MARDMTFSLALYIIERRIVGAILGIELSQLLFHREQYIRAALFSSVKLRITIISFFFMDGIIGGIFYSRMGLRVLLLDGMLILAGLLYDNIKLNIILLKRKLKRMG